MDLNRRYPMNIFPGIWERLGELATSERLVAPREVLRELEKGDDELLPWARQHAKMFQDPDDLHLATVQVILEHFPDFVDSDKETPEADPFVVARAIVGRSSGSMLPQNWVVVAEENRRRRPEHRPRIPDVCDHYNVAYMRMFDVMRVEGWTFR